MRSRKLLLAVGFTAAVAIGLFAGHQLSKMGNTDSPSTPNKTSSYTLEDIYDRLDTGATPSQSTFTEPNDPPGTGTMHTLNEIMALIPDAGSDVSGGEGLVTFDIPDGLYRSKSATAADAELLEENIKDGVDIFGVTGTLSCGERLTDNGDGTITDNLTKLMWTKNANHGLKTWTAAKDYCDTYSYADHTDWGLPVIWQLYTLIDANESDPILPAGHPFENVQLFHYWSATWADDPSSETRNGYAMILTLAGTSPTCVSARPRLGTQTAYPWPVRAVP
jgi:uncharacterized protein DUF1566